MGIGSYNEDETITDDYIDFIKARAPGTGLIITTGTRVTEKYGKYRINGCYDRKFMPGLAKLAETAKSAGSKIFLQILALGPADPYQPFVPWMGAYKEEILEKLPVKPLELDSSQVMELIESFIYGAGIACEAGFDGVELFGSEDGLISAFMCPHLNKRQDSYGGNFENRMRFPVEIIRGIKKDCGNDFEVGFKFNAYYGIDEGIDLNLGAEIAEKIASEGAAYIHCWSFETFEKPMSVYRYSPMPGQYQPRNSLTEISGYIKRKLQDRTRVIAVGGILKPVEADKIIAFGQADIVAVGRAFIADNLWSSKSSVIHPEKIRPCIRCHVCHNEVAVNGKLVVCSVNPDVLAKDKITRTENPHRVAVAGAGPAGIMSAVTCRARGHIVTVFEKSNNAGGKLIAGSAPDFKYEFRDLLRYLENELVCSGAMVKTGIEVFPESFKEDDFDVLIVACGASTFYPDISGIKGNNVIDAVSGLNNPAQFAGKNIAIIGGGDVGCETALFLKRNGSAEVTIIEMLDELMKNEIEHNRIVLKRMLSEESINIRTSAVVKEITPEGVILDAAGKKQSQGLENLAADYVIIAAGYRPPSDFLKSFESLGIKKFFAGDCAGPGRLREAISSGYNAGMSV
jgi:2,4-dienoyl-CoA reductase-like NADH-dependent reductase (Old Yellow Enzyme family)/thioredoxin reductase